MHMHTKAPFTNEMIGLILKRKDLVSHHTGEYILGILRMLPFPPQQNLTMWFITNVLAGR